jgi:hypothetical protein
MTAAPQASGKEDATPTSGGSGGGKGDDGLSRLVKLAPSEVMTVYLAGKAAFPKDIPMLGLVMLIVCFLWRWWTTLDKDKPAQWLPVISATVSFALWVYASGGSILTSNGLNPTQASFIALFWTVLVAPNLPGNKGA